MSMKEETQKSRSSLALWELYFNGVHNTVLTNMLVFKSPFGPFIPKNTRFPCRPTFGY